MKQFMDENFLLKTKTAEKLYHDHAAKLPIIDYHCHLIPQEVGEDKQFQNLTQAWLYGDHYKWRGMRSNGIDERFCTGNATDYEKFEKWAETVPYTLRNPLYHWTHLELRRYFGITDLLNPLTAKKIYTEASAKLVSREYSVRGLMTMMNVEVVCTTDDPADDLAWHKKVKQEGFRIKVLPTWRPDKAMAVENPELYKSYLKKLGETANVEITSFSSLLEALLIRHDFFDEMGCRLSDRGLENFIAEDYTEAEIEAIFKKVLAGKIPDKTEVLKFKTAMLYHFGVMDHAKGWTTQYHVGAMRNNNTRRFKQLGPDTGFDSIGDYAVATPMSRFLDKLDSEDKLSRTILYNLNPSDNEVMATMLGNFQGGGIPGKIQFGSGWWFLDQKDGMERQINALSTLGLLSRFVGMLTDSRSLLSYPRHEYFRRILCNLIGTDVENGEMPNDMGLLGQMVENISYYNAKNYFNF
ncbi:MAG: glucuronate isomerase [Bacteroidales bacterium]|nr:glucuronate isomerase [Bacteroidales bacterium]